MAVAFAAPAKPDVDALSALFPHPAGPCAARAETAWEVKPLIHKMMCGGALPTDTRRNASANISNSVAALGR